MATSEKYPERVIKTIIGEVNDVEDRISGTYPLLPHTTLNALYNVFPNQNDEITGAPDIGYFGIGINGCYNVGDKNQSAPYQPKAHELNLYEPIPFRIVPIEQDLSTAERTLYRMRTEIIRNGQRYWAYYLKKLEVVDVSAKVVRIDPETGVETPHDFSQEFLTPTPVKGEVSGVIDGAATEVVVVKRVRANLTGSEVYEAINVLYDGDLTMAKISEWGIFTGQDSLVQGFDHAGVGFSYTESLYVQMSYKLCNISTGVHSPEWNGSRIFTFGNGKLIHSSV